MKIPIQTSVYVSDYCAFRPDVSLLLPPPFPNFCQCRASPQVHRDFRKPLILITPKSLLKMRQCVSTREEFTEGTYFQRIIPEQEPESLVADDKVCACECVIV